MSDTTRLLVLGAGEDQIAAYREASRRGWRTIGVDMRADAPAVALADSFLHISTRDADAVRAAVGDTSVAGVIAPAGDAAQPSVRRLAELLGLPVTVSERAAACSADKAAFRALVDELGLPCYRSFTATDHEALADWIRAAGTPTVVKPTDSSGSKGVVRVSAPELVHEALAEAASFSPSGRLIAEEFVTGRDVSAECFFVAGELRVCLVAERSTTGPPHLITVTHWAPADLPDRVRAEIEAVIATVGRALGLHDGPLNVDLVVDDSGRLYVIEMGARLGGNGMPQLVALALGVDTVAAAVDLACGLPFDVVPEPPRAAAIHILHSDVGGRLVAVHGLSECADLGSVRGIEMFAGPGDDIRPYTRAANKLGYVLLSAANREDLRDDVARVRKHFGVDIDARPDAVTGPDDGPGA